MPGSENFWLIIRRVPVVVANESEVIRWQPLEPPSSPKGRLFGDLRDTETPW